MKKIIAIIVLGAVLTACAGRGAMPVAQLQPGDNRKSCEALRSDIELAQADIQRLTPQTEKTGKNVALGVAGFFFLIPLLFMDLSDAERQEINALQNRNNRLMSIAVDKKCDWAASN